MASARDDAVRSAVSSVVALATRSVPSDISEPQREVKEDKPADHQLTDTLSPHVSKLTTDGYLKELVCPISLEAYQTPIMAPDDHAYEFDFLNRHFETEYDGYNAYRSPLTRKIIEPDECILAPKIARIVKEYKEVIIDGVLAELAEKHRKLMEANKQIQLLTQALAKVEKKQDSTDEINKELMRAMPSIPPILLDNNEHKQDNGQIVRGLFSHRGSSFGRSSSLFSRSTLNDRYPKHVKNNMFLNSIKCRHDISVICARLANGADMHAKDSVGNTALHFAAANNDLTTVSFLINEGAERFARNKADQTPLEYALAAHRLSGQAMDGQIVAQLQLLESIAAARRNT